MQQLQWSDEYSVGNELLDTHHRIFFDMVMELHRYVTTDECAIDLPTMISFLGDYADMHFHAEEHYMATIGFPELKPHSIVHQHFVESVHGLLTTTQSLTAILDFMQHWLIQHILREDKLYALYAQRSAKTKTIGV